MSWRDREPMDYPRWYYSLSQHAIRYRNYVREHGLTCQECGGRGQFGYVSCYALEPPEPCGYCETTGKVTRWMRGQWLRWKREEKRKQAAKKLVRAA